METTKDVQQALDSAVAEYGVPGVIAALQDENGVRIRAAGVSDLGTGRRREPGERFTIGSGAKAFTAAAVLTLEAEGRLSLTDTVEQWLPGVVRGNGNDGRRITIGQLLTHTSGLGITGLNVDIARKYHTRPGFAAHRYDVWTVEELLNLQMAIPPLYAPGTDFAYCNGGYHLAGAIIEKVTGRSYEDEIERMVIQPLGLTDTYARPFAERRFRGSHARIYTRQFLQDGVDPEILTPDNYESLLESADSDPVDVTDRAIWGWAAGGIVSSTRDMLRFTDAVITGSLLPPAQHRAMWTTVPTRDWMPNTRYGTGVSQWALADGRTIHIVAGVELGAASFTMGTPDGRHVVSVNINCDWNWYPVFSQVAEAVFGSPFQMPR
ncbi:serine hydrolase domain-containing protein [Nocardia sp. NPDC127579]|uniref:serine hydrolase domain-containing protein n=1 Tax=Nocardia sp. NPDC127579 TaxID=3345402 RepID=UPI0036293E1A